ncbi:MAG: site-specific DNA-methyltransferase [Myxococcales bacterium]|nr:site-specific DNA-methyltransferase [Myxococcales bacterium]
MSREAQRGGVDRTKSAHTLWHGDAARVCELLPAERRFELVYLDPPYSVGATMTMRERSGEARGRMKKGSGRAAYGDVLDVDGLVAMLASVLVRVRDRMTDDGALYLHMDWRAVHDAKVAADRIFGRRAFAGEVCWLPGNGSRGARGFAVTHQTILVYAAKEKRLLRFAVDHPSLREPFAETSQAMHFTNVDADGRRYRDRTVGAKTYRYYADEGRRIGSVWADIPAMVANTPLRKEGTGYPTQKPEKLLERIVRASSREGETVADLMCGSGTTLAVAARLGRRFVGADASDVAIEITRARLAASGVDYRFSSTEPAAPSEALHS